MPKTARPLIRYALDWTGDGDFTCPHCGGAVDLPEQVVRPRRVTFAATLACLSCKNPLHHPGEVEACEHCDEDVWRCDVGTGHHESPTGWTHAHGEYRCSPDADSTEVATA